MASLNQRFASLAMDVWKAPRIQRLSAEDREIDATAHSDVGNFQITEDSSTNNIHKYNGPRSLSVPDHQGPHPTAGWRANLLPYLLQPELYSHAVVRETADTLLIQDKYPKAKVHLLLLPKWLPHRDLHPHDAFADEGFLAMVKKEVKSALPIAISQFTNHLLDYAVGEKPKSANRRAKILEKVRQNCEKIFQVGIHAHPSQLQLHIHIISRDMDSDALRHVRHYSSFLTPFFIPLSHYPLAFDDIRRNVEYQNKNLEKEDCQCWKCGEDYGFEFLRLKSHLR